MLMRTNPFRELDRLTQQVLGTRLTPAAVPMDAFRQGDTFVVRFDLPGVRPDAIDLGVERNVLTVRAERRSDLADDAQPLVAERPTGTFTRQLFLADSLDTDRIEARYVDGVLTVTIPVADAAKSRRIAVGGGGDRQAISA